MNRNLITVRILCGILLGGAVGVFFLLKYLLQLPMYVDREIAADVSIEKDWIEFTPKSTMKINRRHQAVTLFVDRAMAKREPSGLILRDGTQIEPEVQIADINGNWYVLEGGSYTLGDGNDPETGDRYIKSASFKARDPELPANTEFKTIRIRSETPFKCDKVIWRNYNLK
jgi:hypothetical protein